MSNVPISLTIGQIIFGMAMTLLTTVGGAYITIKVNEAQNEQRILYLEKENVERKEQVKDLTQEVKELRDTQTKDIKEILRVLGEIQKDIGGKANR